MSSHPTAPFLLGRDFMARGRMMTDSIFRGGIILSCKVFRWPSWGLQVGAMGREDQEVRCWRDGKESGSMRDTCSNTMHVLRYLR